MNIFNATFYISVGLTFKIFLAVHTPQRLATEHRTRQLAAKLTHFALSFLSQSAIHFDLTSWQAADRVFLAFQLIMRRKPKAKYCYYNQRKALTGFSPADRKLWGEWQGVREFENGMVILWHGVFPSIIPTFHLFRGNPISGGGQTRDADTDKCHTGH